MQGLLLENKALSLELQTTACILYGIGAGQYERRYLAMSIFNEEQLKAMFSREYICHECGHLMELSLIHI